MPDGFASIPISVRLPADVIDTLDKVAVALDRPRSWVILRALRQYLADEGAEVLDVREGIAELGRGEVVPYEDVVAELEQMIARAKHQAG